MPTLRKLPGMIPAADFPRFVPIAELRRVEAERDAALSELARYRAVVEVLTRHEPRIAELVARYGAPAAERR